MTLRNLQQLSWSKTYIQKAFLYTFLWVYSGTSLFQPHLGPAKVAGLERWLDLRKTSLYHSHTLMTNLYQNPLAALVRGGCISEAWNNILLCSKGGLILFCCAEYFYMEAANDYCPASDSRAPEDLDMRKGDLLRVYRANNG